MLQPFTRRAFSNLALGALVAPAVKAQSMTEITVNQRKLLQLPSCDVNQVFASIG